MYTTKYRNYAHPAQRTNFFFDDVFTRDFFGNSPKRNATVPAANVKETPEKFVIELAAPGMEKSDFNVKFEDQVLTISSEKKKEEKVEGEKYTRKEFVYNSFSRSFSVPENVDGMSIKASYQNGLLNIELPKKAEEPKLNSKQIEIS